MPPRKGIYIKRERSPLKRSLGEGRRELKSSAAAVTLDGKLQPPHMWGKRQDSACSPHPAELIFKQAHYSTVNIIQLPVMPKNIIR